MLAPAPCLDLNGASIEYKAARMHPSFYFRFGKYDKGHKLLLNCAISSQVTDPAAHSDSYIIPEEITRRPLWCYFYDMDYQYISIEV